MSKRSGSSQGKKASGKGNIATGPLTDDFS